MLWSTMFVIITFSYKQLYYNSNCLQQCSYLPNISNRLRWYKWTKLKIATYPSQQQQQQHQKGLEMWMSIKNKKKHIQCFFLKFFFSLMTEIIFHREICHEQHLILISQKNLDQTFIKESSINDVTQIWKSLDTSWHPSFPMTLLICLV